MHVLLPPFALATPRFTLRAVTALAGRAPLGGERETVLCTLMAARLAAGARPPCPFTPAVRSARAAGARLWFASLTVPATLRVPFTRVVDATVPTDGDHRALGLALQTLVDAAAASLDDGARRELLELARAIGAG